MKKSKKTLFCLGCMLFLCLVITGSTVAGILLYRNYNKDEESNTSINEPSAETKFISKQWNDFTFSYPDGWIASFGDNIVILKPIGADFTEIEPANETIMFMKTPLSDENQNMTIDNLKGVDLSESLQLKGAVILSQSKMQINQNTWLKSTTEWKDKSDEKNKYTQISYSTIIKSNSYSVFYQFGSHTDKAYITNAEKTIQSITLDSTNL